MAEDVATSIVPPRDRVAELEAELHRLVRRGRELAKQKQTVWRDEAIAETRAEYKRVHGKWLAEKNQMRLW